MIAAEWFDAIDKAKPKKVVFCVPILRKPYKQFVESLEAEIPLIHAAGWQEELVQEIDNPYIGGAEQRCCARPWTTMRRSSCSSTTTCPGRRVNC
jgi:hypothetical protein